MTAARAVAAGAPGAAASAAGRGRVVARVRAAVAGAAGHELMGCVRAAMRAGRRSIVKNQFFEIPAAFFATVLIDGHDQSSFTVSACK